MQWYRMLLIELDEVEFKHVPSHVREQIYNWLRGLQTTTTTEYVSHDLRKLGNSFETWKAEHAEEMGNHDAELNLA